MARTLYSHAVRSTDVAKQPNGTKTLSGATETLVAANKDRIALLITHTGAADAWLAFNGVPAAANTGLRIRSTDVMPYVIEGYTGAVSIIGTATQIVTFIEI